MQSRKPTRVLRLGRLTLGGGAPVVVQSMTNTDTRDVDATLDQIERLVRAGCEAVRVAVPDEEAARAVWTLRRQVAVPLIADIHFDYRLALSALDAGVQGLRINPGNIGSQKNVDAVVDAAKANGAVLRIGVNGGSLEKTLLQKYGGATPEAMVESALGHVRLLEKREFYDTKISLKSSSVLETIAAYRLLAERCDYPLHIGVTEAGGLLRGSVKSSVGLGILLWEGIGDTLRVSLTADPVEEVVVAWEILRALG
ncbi:MAG: flavodoxin-dependent (E)-4-hydroxy-3-methylbut-2-enyl-diphosphate synthase, partial [Desulfovibrionaceae bacterium]|nr:flavodoxin-dependent (E)-4-hydroxy-3-methylbut-2-enyl-diphosphate synthase [Desulfovibrionaceae bacterium]